MAVQTATAPNALGTKFIVDYTADASAENNITAATSGTLYLIEVDNTANSAPSYFKLVDASSTTVGSTAADLVLPAAATSTARYVFPEGYGYTAGLSVWCVTGVLTASNSSPSNDVIISILAT